MICNELNVNYNLKMEKETIRFRAGALEIYDLATPKIIQTNKTNPVV
jgi:hypothetical protein